MKWIECSRRMPEDDMNVIVWAVPYDNQCNSFFHVDRTRKGMWVCASEVTITHWMNVEKPI